MDNLEKQSGHFGWGLPEQTPAEISSSEAKAFQDFANVMSRKIMRQPAKSIKNMELTTKIVKLQEEDSIEEGFSFLHLEKALFGQELSYKPQLIGSCIRGDSLVRMADGTQKQIKDIIVGDMVIGHSGQPRRVNHTFFREYTGKMYTVKTIGDNAPIVMTADHKMATVPWKGWRYDKSTADLENFEYLRADQLTEGQDRLLQPTQYNFKNDFEIIDLLNLFPDFVSIESDSGEKIKRKDSQDHNGIFRHIAVTPSLCRLFGIFTAEGGVCKQSGYVQFSFNSNEYETLAEEVVTLVRGIFGAEAYKYIEENNRCNVKVYNRALGSVLKHYIPGNVYDKQIPSFVWGADNKCKIAFINGWLDGDGCELNNKGCNTKKIVGVTVSKKLAEDIQFLANTAGLMCTKTKRKARKQSKAAFDLSFNNTAMKVLSGELKELKKVSNTHKYGIARRITSITSEDVVNFPVYDIEVDIDHSFIVHNKLSSNCVASGGRIVDTKRMLAEVFIFNEAQDLMGSTFQGKDSFQPFAPFNYRLGRAYVGLNGGRASGADDGSLCAPHFRGKMEVGFLPCNAEGLQSDFFPEPQNVATYRLWGANDTLVNQFKSKVICKLTETEKVITADDVKTLICVHLKPLQICSMWAFEAGNRHPSWTWGGQPVTIYRRSRQQWAHNLSIVGCVKVKGSWYVIIQNTWGNMHNGRDWFPITLETMDQWLKDRDTECMSNGNFSFEKDLPPAVQ